MEKSMKKLESQFEAFSKITLCKDTEDAKIFAECTVKQLETILITGADIVNGGIIVHGYHCLMGSWITYTLTEPDNVFIIPEQLNVTIHDVLQLAVFGDCCQAIRVICIEALFSNNLIELPKGITCEIVKPYKVNQPFKSLSVTLEDTRIGISIPFGEMALWVLKNNIELDTSFVKKVIEYSVEQLKYANTVADCTSIDFNDVSKIYGYLINAEANKHIKEYALYREVADLLLVYRYVLQDSSQGCASAIISKTLANNYGWSEEFLYEQWMKNTNGASSYKIEPILNILQEHLGTDEISENIEYNPDIYVLTNSIRLNASGVALRPEIMRDLQKIFGIHFYLVPSSVNEFLAFPMTIPVDVVKQMVSEVNAQCLAQNDLLSYNVYRYDFDTMELKVI